MTEPAAIAVLACSGVLALAPVRRVVTPRAAVLMSLVVGTAGYFLSSLLLVAVGQFSVWRAVVLFAGVASVLFVVEVAREDSRRSIITTTALAALVAGVVAFGLAMLAVQTTFVRISFDSVFYMMAGSALESSGSMDGMPFSFGEVLKRQLAIPAIQAVGVLTGEGYARAWTPVLSFSALAATVWFAWKGRPRTGVSTKVWTAIVATAAAFMLTTHQVLLHVFYVNGHMVFAAILVVGAWSAWLSVVEGDDRLSLFAGLMLSALVLIRAEAVIVVAIFLIPALSRSDASARSRWCLVLPSVVVTFLWYGWAISSGWAAFGDGREPSVLGNLAIAVGLVAVAVAAGFPSARWLFDRLSWLLIAGPVGFLALWLIVDFEDAAETLRAMGVNVGWEGFWGPFMWVIPVLILMAAAVVRVPRQELILFPLASFVLTLPALAFLRGISFRVGWGDSGNRMIMHVVLVAVVYLIIAVATAARSVDVSAAETEQPAGGRHTTATATP